MPTIRPSMPLRTASDIAILQNSTEELEIASVAVRKAANSKALECFPQVSPQVSPLKAP